MLATLLLATLYLTAHALPLSTPSTSIHPLYLFPNGTALENLYVREDGSVLVSTIYPAAELYYFQSPSSSPVLLANFTGSAAAYGIAEYQPKVFSVFSGTFSRAGDVTNATGIAWRVDLSSLGIGDNGQVTSPAQVSVISRLTDVGFLNGAVALDSEHVLVADSVKGVVYSVNTRSGIYTTVLNDTILAPNDTGPVRLGVNGLQLVNDTLFFTNTNKRMIGKVPLNDDGTASGAYSVVASNVLVDDLDVDPATGAVYIASLVANAITYVAPNGTVSVLAGSLNSTDVPGPTAIRFARAFGTHAQHSKRLLVSTSGGIEYPINGTYIQGGGLYELDTGRSCF